MILELKRLNFKDLRVGVFTLALLFFFYGGNNDWRLERSIF